MTGKMQWDCTALFNYLFIDYDRKIYPCPIHDVCVGDLSKATVGQILESETAMSVRRKVGAYPLCRQCTEPGAVRYSQVLEGKSLLAFIQAKGRENYAKVILDRGLDKLLFD
ncbi:MAG: SPASM domain-containing protein [Firmicutes bacterium]|nr:SPASM domain-containing protein [Bacillota bacterium]